MTSTIWQPKFFWVLTFCALQLIAWTLIPTFIFPNLPLDVHEGIMWGQTWQLGYYKHPPLQAWLLELTHLVVGQQRWGYFLLAQITVVTGILGVYATSRLFVDETKSTIATLALFTIYYFNISSIEFNPNTLQLAIWPWVIFFFVRAINNDLLKDWLLLGFVTALSFYAKYFSGILIFSLLLILFLIKKYRKNYKNLKFYMALFVTVLCLMPHLIWLYEHNFLPFQYALSRTEVTTETFLVRHIVFALKFLLVQLIVLVPLILIFYLFWFKSKYVFSFSAESRLVFFIAWLPLFLLIAISIIFGLKLKDMWGTPLLGFISVWLMRINSSHEIVSNGSLSKKYIKTVIVSFALFLVILCSIQMIGKSFKRLNFDGQTLAEIWQAHWNFKQAPYTIIANHWLGANASFYSDSRPLVFIDGDIKKSPWIKEGNIIKKGAILIASNTIELTSLAEKNNLIISSQLKVSLNKTDYWIGFVLPFSNEELKYAM